MQYEPIKMNNKQVIVWLVERGNPKLDTKIPRHIIKDSR